MKRKKRVLKFKKGFKSKHNLEFLARPYVSPIPSSMQWVQFRVGTCSGIYGATPDCYMILAIDNDKPGNGHFEDVLEWFERSCRRDGKNLMFAEILNPKFGKHLEEVRGFEIEGANAIKRF